MVYWKVNVTYSEVPDPAPKNPDATARQAGGMAWGDPLSVRGWQM